MVTCIVIALVAKRCPHARAAALAAAIVLAWGAALGSASARADWPWSGWFGQGAAVGTSQWWDDHKSEAEFVPGKGYTVPGAEGYFDSAGRPLDRPVEVSRNPLSDDDKPEKGLLPELDPRVTYTKVKSAVGLGPNDQAARDAFDEGQRLFEQGRYQIAATKFHEAAGRAVGSRLQQDAMFMIAESYFFDDRYIKARDAYNDLASKHPNTKHLDLLVDRLWKIARYWEQYEQRHPDWTGTPNLIDKTRPRLDTIGHAIKTYDSIRMNDPTGPRADDAIMATANIYFRQGKFDDADYHYTLLRREYPRSEFQFEAHLLGLQAKLRKYQGADYDGTPLEEAKQLVKQLRVQFAGQLGAEERERLRQVSAELNKKIAMRDYRMAKFYDDTKFYGSARYYYAEVVKKHPDSELAQEARDRIARITGEPDEPPKRLAWFVDLFPESSERAAMAGIPELREGGTRLARAPSVDNQNSDGADSPSSTTQ